MGSSKAGKWKEWRWTGKGGGREGGGENKFPFLCRPAKKTCKIKHEGLSDEGGEARENEEKKEPRKAKGKELGSFSGRREQGTFRLQEHRRNKGEGGSLSTRGNRRKKKSPLSIGWAEKGLGRVAILGKKRKRRRALKIGEAASLERKRGGVTSLSESKGSVVAGVPSWGHLSWTRKETKEGSRENP